jgi:tetratricopeptide (TPR) repeat protein
MKKSIPLLLLAALVVVVVAFGSTPAQAQNGTVRGVARDMQGNPMVGATVEMVNKENGRRYTFKTNKKGEYFSIGILYGTYDFTLSKDGQKLFAATGVRVPAFDETVVDFDLRKIATEQAPEMTPEEKKEQQEAIKKQEIRNQLNDKLAASKAAEDAGNLDQAVQLLREASQLEPDQPAIWVHLGDLLRLSANKATDVSEKNKRFAEAIDAYQKSLALKPAGGAYNNMADALIKSGKTQEGIAAYNKAVEIDPLNAGQYYYNMGAVLTNTGKIDEALAAFDKAIAADPKRADAFYWKGVNLLGKATLKGNKMVAPEGTAEAFNQYLALEPNGKFAEPAKQMLASIGAPIETSFGKGKGAKKK